MPLVREQVGGVAGEDPGVGGGAAGDGGVEASVAGQFPEERGLCLASARVAEDQDLRPVVELRDQVEFDGAIARRRVRGRSGAGDSGQVDEQDESHHGDHAKVAHVSQNWK